jgi:hypothetical protein
MDKIVKNIMNLSLIPFFFFGCPCLSASSQSPALVVMASVQTRPFKNELIGSVLDGCICRYSRVLVQDEESSKHNHLPNLSQSIEGNGIIAT